MRLAVLLMAMAGIALAQQVIPVQQPGEGIWPCHAGTNFETEKYTVVRTTVDDPFQFLYWIGGKSRSIESQLAAKLNNRPFTYQTAVKEALSTIESARFSPNSLNGFSVTVEFVSVQNCNPEKRTLEVIYRIYSTNPAKFLGGATESQAVATQSPQTTTGLGQAGNPFHFTPSGGYNRSDGVFGGGRLQIKPNLNGFHLFDTFTAEGQGSYSMRSISVALDGSANLRGWIKHSGWSLNYQNHSAPAGATQLRQAGLAGQIDAETRPFWKDTFLARLGGLIQGGNMQSGVPAGLLAPQTVANAGYGSLKGFAGLSSRTSHNVFSVSYGLELGSVGPSAQIDWRKHIGDVVDEFWIPVGDHKPFEVESRFTAGGIQVPHSIPLPARFFGGNSDAFFIPGDSWQIRDVPVIRAIPADRFYLTGQGAGADRFASINLTFSYPVKSRPIMPKELSADPEFNKLLQGQIVSATSVEQNYYTWKDPHFGAAFSRLPNLKQLLDALAAAADPSSDCATNISVAQFYVDSALAAKGVAQYGNLSGLLPVGGDSLQAVQDACVGASVGAVAAARAAILSDFNQIDQKAAAQKAAADIAFVKRTLNTLFKDLNIFSVSPVVVFDTAWIGPAKGPLGGTRIGPGGGIRLELVSYVNFTVGYAWNVNRQPGEGQGALFFSIGVRDLFH